MLLAGIAYAAGIRETMVHDYYSAAVYSMSQSWSAWFWGAVDGGSITLDKLPGAFWIQALAVRCFGWSPPVIMAPQVLEALAAMLLLFATVRRWLGEWAGILAAACFAATPIVAALAHSQIADLTLVFWLSAAAYTFTRSIEHEGIRWLVGTGVLVGCAFQAKMTEAWGVLPAMVISYALFAPAKPWRRVANLLVAAVATAVASLWWLVVATVVPAGQRPWIDGSTDNSAWSMVFVYNLTGRESSANWGYLLSTPVLSQVGWGFPLAILGIWFGWRTASGGEDLASRRLRAAVLMAGGWWATFALALSNGRVMHDYYVVAIAPPVAMLAASTVILAWRRSMRHVAAVSLLQGAWLGWMSLQCTGWWAGVCAVGGGILVVTAVLLAWWGQREAGRRRWLAIPAACALVAGGFVAPVAWSVATTQAQYTGSAHSPQAGASDTRGGGEAGGRGDADGRGAPGAAPAASGRKSEARAEGGTRKAPGAEDGGTARQGRGVVDASAVLAALREEGTSTGSEYDAVVSGYEDAAALITAGARVLFVGGYSGSVHNVSLEQIQELVQQGKVRHFIFGSSQRGNLMRSSGDNAVEQVREWVEQHCLASDIADAAYVCTAAAAEEETAE